MSENGKRMKSSLATKIKPITVKPGTDPSEWARSGISKRNSGRNSSQTFEKRE